MLQEEEEDDEMLQEEEEDDEMLLDIVENNNANVSDYENLATAMALDALAGPVQEPEAEPPSSELSELPPEQADIPIPVETEVAEAEHPIEENRANSPDLLGDLDKRLSEP